MIPCLKFPIPYQTVLSPFSVSCLRKILECKFLTWAVGEVRQRPLQANCQGPLVSQCRWTSSSFSLITFDSLSPKALWIVWQLENQLRTLAGSPGWLNDKNRLSFFWIPQMRSKEGNILEVGTAAHWWVLRSSFQLRTKQLLDKNIERRFPVRQFYWGKNSSSSNDDVIYQPIPSCHLCLRLLGKEREDKVRRFQVNPHHQITR